MPALEGHYVKRSGRGLDYSYRVVWSHTNGTVVYEGCVRRDEMEVARPRGQFRCDEDQEALMVRRIIEAEIEQSVIE